MSGWDQTRRIALSEPWQDFWIELWEDPPMGAWLDLQEAAREALANPVPPAIEACIIAFQPLIAKHNLKDRAGGPITELTLRTLSSGLYQALLGALRTALNGPPASAKRERSRAPSSPKPRSRRASPSGA